MLMAPEAAPAVPIREYEKGGRLLLVEGTKTSKPIRTSRSQIDRRANQFQEFDQNSSLFHWPLCLFMIAFGTGPSDFEPCFFGWGYSDSPFV
jgi:hypothetical protein